MHSVHVHLHVRVWSMYMNECSFSFKDVKLQPDSGVPTEYFLCACRNILPIFGERNVVVFRGKTVCYLYMGSLDFFCRSHVTIVLLTLYRISNNVVSDKLNPAAFAPIKMEFTGNVKVTNCICPLCRKGN